MIIIYYKTWLSPITTHMVHLICVKSITNLKAPQINISTNIKTKHIRLFTKQQPVHIHSLFPISTILLVQIFMFMRIMRSFCAYTFPAISLTIH